MEFENARLLWGLPALLVLFCWLVRAGRESRRWHLGFTRKHRGAAAAVLGSFCLTAAAGTILLALAGPKVEYQKRVLNRSGIDLCLGIDVSKSMLAEDVELPAAARELFAVPNRLNRARLYALDLLQELKGERIAVFIFASDAVEIIPFTQDYGYSKYMIRHVSDTEITASGSDLGVALQMAAAMLGETQEGKLKRLILLTDGEDISADQSSLYESARLAGDKGIQVYGIGIGMGKSVLIPIRIPSTTAVAEYFLDEDGTPLRTSLNPETLERIASLSGGRFLKIEQEESSPHRLVESILSQARTSTETQSVEPAWFDLAPVFLISGIGLCLAGVFLSR